MSRKRRSLQSITHHRFATRRKLVLGTAPDKRSNVVAAFEQERY
jgi:hypothetical protein